MVMQNVTQQDREMARAVARTIGRVVEHLHNARVINLPGVGGREVYEGELDDVASRCADIFIRRLETEAVNFD